MATIEEAQQALLDAIKKTADRAPTSADACRAYAESYALIAGTVKPSLPKMTSTPIPPALDS